MTVPVQHLRNAYRPLLDAAADSYDKVHEEPERVSIEVLRRHLRAVYAEDRRLRRVAVRVAGVDVGVSTRTLVERDTGVAGGNDIPIGAGERASHSGDSTRYRMVLFGCPTCDAEEALVFYDERRIPRCERHGTMELIP